MIVKQYSTDEGWAEPKMSDAALPAFLKDLLKNADAGLHYDAESDTLVISLLHKGTYTPCGGCGSMSTAPHACPGWPEGQGMPTYVIVFSTPMPSLVKVMKYLRDHHNYTLEMARNAVVRPGHILNEEYPDRETAETVAAELLELGVSRLEVVATPVCDCPPSWELEDGVVSWGLYGVANSPGGLTHFKGCRLIRLTVRETHVHD